MDQGQSSRPRGLNVGEDGFLTAEGVLEETQAGMIRETMKEILASFDADVAGLPQHRSGIHLVEVGSSGASGLRGAVEDRHGNAARMSPYEFDFGRKSGLEQALEAARSLAPALMSMWVSVPCAALEEPEDTLAGLGEEQRPHTITPQTPCTQSSQDITEAGRGPAGQRWTCGMGSGRQTARRGRSQR